MTMSLKWGKVKYTLSSFCPYLTDLFVTASVNISSKITRHKAFVF